MYAIYITRNKEYWHEKRKLCFYLVLSSAMKFSSRAYKKMNEKNRQISKQEKTLEASLVIALQRLLEGYMNTQEINKTIVS